MSLKPLMDREGQKRCGLSLFLTDLPRRRRLLKRKVRIMRRVILIEELFSGEKNGMAWRERDSRLSELRVGDWLELWRRGAPLQPVFEMAGVPFVKHETCRFAGPLNELLRLSAPCPRKTPQTPSECRILGQKCYTFSHPRNRQPLVVPQPAPLPLRWPHGPSDARPRYWVGRPGRG